MSLRRDIVSMLRREGFRQCGYGKHDKWTDGKHRIVVPHTPSDRRTLLNVRAFIRRIRRGK